MRLRSHLIALVLAVLLPLITFSALAIVMLDRYQRTNMERSALELARALMSAVDEALRSTITTQADWQDVILLAPDGRQLIHTGRPWGTPLPTAAEPASLEQVVSTRRPAVGSI